MTYDEWKKARVEAAILTFIWTARIGLPTTEIEDTWRNGLIAALKALDAVPLLGKEEVIVEAVSALISRENVNSQDAIRYAWAVIDALRPWLATMIEKGKGV